MKRRLSTVSVLFLVIITVLQTNATAGDKVFDPVISHLLQDGLDSTHVTHIFNDARIRFIDALVVANIVPRDNPDAYQKFLMPEQVNDGKQFLQERGTEIQHLLNGTDIPIEIVVSILKIESDLGRNPGKLPVVAALATISSINHKKYWKSIADTSATLTVRQLKIRAEKRSKWAYGELLTFLKLCNFQGWDPIAIRGSWAGAFGWAQFLPSSYTYCARDGDGDGDVDPYSLQDAVASLVCYLQHAHWGVSQKDHRKALHRYNPSNAYVDAVLEYASCLKTQEQTRCSGSP